MNSTSPSSAHRSTRGSNPHRGVAANAGYTIVELVAATVVTLIIALAITQFYIGSNVALAHIRGQSTLQLQLTFAANDIFRDVRTAAIAQRVAGLPQACNDLNNNLLLTVPSIDSSQLPLEGTFDTITYSFDNTQGVLTRSVALGPGSVRSSASRVVARDLVRQCGTSGGTVFAPPLQGPSGTSNTVIFTLNGSRRERDRTHLLTFTSQARLRN